MLTGASRNAVGARLIVMTATDHKQRLTLAVLDGAESVFPAVDALLAEGFDAKQIGLAASSVSLDRLEQLSRLKACGHQWFQRVLPELKSAAPGVEATPGPLLAYLARQRALKRQVARRDGWIPDSFEAALLGYIRQGRVVLGVSAMATRQQWASVRILLGQAAGEVRTFEFAPGDGENPLEPS